MTADDAEWCFRLAGCFDAPPRTMRQSGCSFVGLTLKIIYLKVESKELLPTGLVVSSSSLGSSGCSYLKNDEGCCGPSKLGPRVALFEVMPPGSKGFNDGQEFAVVGLVPSLQESSFEASISIQKQQ